MSELKPPIIKAKLPTMFIGSSSEGLKVAEAISERLKTVAEVTIWNEGVFDLNRGTLEELIRAIDEFDFAALVLTPDDVTDSRGDAQYSPRDNVLFECGLFVGNLGRERTFIIYDGSRDIKIPSDLAGVTLATYNGGRIDNNPHAAVRGTCSRISQAIQKSEYGHAYQLMGDWKSKYWLTKVNGEKTLVEDNVEVKPFGGKIYLESKDNPQGDNYIAYGQLIKNRHLIGDWKSIRPTANAYGAFLLTIHPWGNIMYGYFVGPDSYNRVMHSTWILARKEGEVDVDKLLAEGDEILINTSHFVDTISASSNSYDSHHHLNPERVEKGKQVESEPAV